MSSSLWPVTGVSLVGRRQSATSSCGGRRPVEPAGSWTYPYALAWPSMGRRCGLLPRRRSAAAGALDSLARWVDRTLPGAGLLEFLSMERGSSDGAF